MSLLPVALSGTDPERKSPVPEPNGVPGNSVCSSSSSSPLDFRTLELPQCCEKASREIVKCIQSISLPKVTSSDNQANSAQEPKEEAKYLKQDAERSQVSCSLGQCCQAMWDKGSKWCIAKCKQLSEVSDADGLIKWSQSLWNDVSSTVSEFVSDPVHTIQNWVTEFEELNQETERLESAHEIEDLLEKDCLIAEEMQVLEKQKSGDQENNFLYHSSSEQTERENTLKESQFVHKMTALSSKFIDPAGLEELKLELLLNHISSEDLPDLRRFLSEIESEERKKRAHHES